MIESLQSQTKKYCSTDSEIARKWFSTVHLKNNLKAQSVKGGLHTISGQAVSFILSIGSNLVLARMLAPENFGLIAMVTAVSGFVTLFADMGLSTSIIQKDQINQKQVSVIFWINAAISLRAQARIELRSDDRIVLHSEDTSTTVEAESWQEMQELLDSARELHEWEGEGPVSTAAPARRRATSRPRRRSRLQTR